MKVLVRNLPDVNICGIVDDWNSLYTKKELKATYSGIPIFFTSESKDPGRTKLALESENIEGVTPASFLEALAKLLLPTPNEQGKMAQLRGAFQNTPLSNDLHLRLEYKAEDKLALNLVIAFLNSRQFFPKQSGSALVQTFSNVEFGSKVSLTPADRNHTTIVIEISLPQKATFIEVLQWFSSALMPAKVSAPAK